MSPTEVTFSTSEFIPLAVGFFGLATGYLIFGPEELVGYPKRSRGVDITTGIWGIWMPGFMQFLTGVYLWVGLAWLHSFRDPALYMAALAFTAYGVHWWAIGLGRALGSDARPNALMSIPFLVISVLGAFVFFHVGDNPVGWLFVGLSAVYVAEFFASSTRSELAEKALGLFHLATGAWLLYLVWAATLNFAAGYHWWL